MSKNRLGRGLDALIADNNQFEENSRDSKLREIFIDQIEANPYQPRQDFDQEALEELANSVKEKGIIQPIIVRQVKPQLYQLVAGERRWRASQLIGLKKVPALIKEYSDQQMMETALIENLMREDLNALEEAQAYQKMIDQFKLTQEEVAKKVGKSRSSIANIVRLLNLPPKIQIYVSRETLSMGHARALLAIKEPQLQIKAADHVIKNNLSVRETEKYVHRLNSNAEKNSATGKNLSIEPEWLQVQQIIADYLGTRVKVQRRKNKRVITIECSNYQEIEKLISNMNVS